MPKSQCPKLKGALWNLQLDVVDVYNTLPRPADSNDIIIAKLTRKLQYRNHIFLNL